MTTLDEKCFDKADDFLNELRIDNPKWWPYTPVVTESDKEWERSWYFRGQSNSKWDLKPTAWRDKPDANLTIAKETFLKQGVDRNIEYALSKYHPNLIQGSQEYIHAFQVLLQAFSEGVLILEFTGMADRLGHPVPQLHGWSKNTKVFIEEYAKNLLIQGNDGLWNQGGVALAQHHRVITRLLDWTHNPLKSIFFAALEAAEKPTESNHFAVFAIHRATLDYHIKMVELPYQENAYLQAQEGIFTYDSNGDEFYIEHGRYPSLEESIQLISKNPVSLNSVFRPRKYSLLTSEAPEVLRRLWLLGITKAHLMPNMDSVSDALKTKWKFFVQMTTINP